MFYSRLLPGGDKPSQGFGECAKGIRMGNHRIRVSLYDKLMQAWYGGAHMARFIPHASNVDAAVHKRHILAGQLARFALNNSTPAGFGADAGLCVARLLDKGYGGKALLRAFRAFTRRHPHVYSHTRCKVLPLTYSHACRTYRGLRAQALAMAARVRAAGCTQAPPPAA